MSLSYLQYERAVDISRAIFVIIVHAYRPVRPGATPRSYRNRVSVHLLRLLKSQLW